MTCVQEGCERPVKYVRARLCAHHYLKQWREDQGVVPDSPLCKCGGRLTILWTRAMDRFVVRLRRCQKCLTHHPTVETVISPRMLERTGERLLGSYLERTQPDKGSAGRSTAAGTAS